MTSNALVPQQQQRLGNVTIENARLKFRNFAGDPGPYNEAGDRSFAVVLPPAVAEQMQRDGWNVKSRPPREEGDQEEYHVSVKVSYAKRPPNIVIVTMVWNPQTKDFEPRRTSLPEDLVDLVDSLDIAKADLILNPYRWNMRGNTGVKAYLKSLFITVQQDELEMKYMSIPELGPSANPLQIAAEAFDPDEIIIPEEEIFDAEDDEDQI